MKEERTSKSEASSEILSWVNKTRKLEEKRNIAREKAKWLSKNFEEQVFVRLCTINSSLLLLSVVFFADKVLYSFLRTILVKVEVMMKRQPKTIHVLLLSLSTPSPFLSLLK